jgi:hypothetical protein
MQSNVGISVRMTYYLNAGSMRLGIDPSGTRIRNAGQVRGAKSAYFEALLPEGSSTRHSFRACRIEERFLHS